MEEEPSNSQIELEIKVTYLEDTLNELNQVVYQQQKSIDRLEKQLKETIERVNELEDASGGDIPHVKPPHY